MCTHVEHVGLCTNSFKVSTVMPIWIRVRPLRAKRVSTRVKVMCTHDDISHVPRSASLFGMHQVCVLCVLLSRYTIVKSEEDLN